MYAMYHFLHTQSSSFTPYDESVARCQTTSSFDPCVDFEQEHPRTHKLGKQEAAVTYSFYFDAFLQHSATIINAV